MREFYKNIKLNVYSSMEEYVTTEDLEIVFSDEEGNIIDAPLDKIDFESAECREHFASDDEFSKEGANLYWEAVSEENTITCVILNSKISVSFKEILKMSGHELGHLTDADEFVNSKYPYETELGYTEEETKAMRFQLYVEDAYEISLIFQKMLKESGINLE